MDGQEPSDRDSARGGIDDAQYFRQRRLSCHCRVTSGRQFITLGLQRRVGAPTLGDQGAGIGFLRLRRRCCGHFPNGSVSGILPYAARQGGARPNFAKKSYARSRRSTSTLGRPSAMASERACRRARMRQLIERSNGPASRHETDPRCISLPVLPHLVFGRNSRQTGRARAIPSR